MEKFNYVSQPIEEIQKKSKGISLIRCIYDICKYDQFKIDVRGYELIHFAHGFNSNDNEILKKYSSDLVYAEIEELIKEKEEKQL